MRDRKCIWTLRGRAFILGEDVTNELFWAHVAFVYKRVETTCI